MRFLFLFIVVAGLACIHPTPPIPVVPDQPDAAVEPDAPVSACASACANLGRLGCPEGLEGNCTTVCERAQATKLTDLKPECLAGAGTPGEARACGTVRCRQQSP